MKQKKNSAIKLATLLRKFCGRVNVYTWRDFLEHDQYIYTYSQIHTHIIARYIWPSVLYRFFPDLSFPATARISLFPLLFYFIVSHFFFFFLIYFSLHFSTRNPHPHLVFHDLLARIWDPIEEKCNSPVLPFCRSWIFNKQDCRKSKPPCKETTLLRRTRQVYIVMLIIREFCFADCCHIAIIKVKIRKRQKKNAATEKGKKKFNNDKSLYVN